METLEILKTFYKKQETGRTSECINIFRASGGTNFENFSKCMFDGFNFVQCY